MVYLFIYLFIYFCDGKRVTTKSEKKIEAFDQNKSGEYKKVKELKLYFKHLFQILWPKIKIEGVKIRINSS